MKEERPRGRGYTRYYGKVTALRRQLGNHRNILANLQLERTSGSARLGQQGPERRTKQQTAEDCSRQDQAGERDGCQSIKRGETWEG